MRSILLTDLPIGESACLDEFPDRDSSLRLRELGFVAGTSVTMVRRGFLGDPVEIELRGYRICLRTGDLVGVQVTPQGSAS